ncbi:MAG: TlpA disulfide reductase family protein [Aquihabitans sp.]
MGGLLIYADTVMGVMSDSNEPDATPRAGGLRNLGSRTIAIAVAAALVAALAAALVASLVLDDGSDVAAPVGQTELTPVTGTTPDQLFTVGLIDPDGNTSTLEDHVVDRPLLVNLWARSCAPCIKEMPWLEAVAKTTPQIDVLGVNVQDNLTDAKAMAEQTGITYPWARDTDGEMLVAAEANGLPYSLLIDTDGTLLATKLGAFSSQEDIEQWIAAGL